MSIETILPCASETPTRPRIHLARLGLAWAGLIAMAGAFASPALAGSTNESVIVGYYHTDSLVSYNASNTSQTNFRTTGVTPEGVGWLMGSSLGPNVLLVGNPQSGHVELVNASTGAIMNSNYINGPGSGFDGLAGMALSSNGQYLYVTQSEGSNTGIYEYNTITGQEVGFKSFYDAHDVTFANGTLYASAYQSNHASSEGVWAFNPDFTQNGSPTQVIAPTAPGGGGPALNHATGIAIAGNTLYVGNTYLNSGTTGPSFVQQYTLSNNGLTGTYDQTYSNPTTGSQTNYLLNPFGVTAYDGNVYVASLGTIGTTDGQVTEINPNTGALSTYIAPSSTNVAPKYVSFEAQCVTYVPEPSSLVMLGTAAAAIGAGALARRRRLQLANA